MGYNPLLTVAGAFAAAHAVAAAPIEQQPQHPRRSPRSPSPSTATPGGSWSSTTSTATATDVPDWHLGLRLINDTPALPSTAPSASGSTATVTQSPMSASAAPPDDSSGSSSSGSDDSSGGSGGGGGQSMGTMLGIFLPVFGALVLFCVLLYYLGWGSDRLSRLWGKGRRARVAGSEGANGDGSTSTIEIATRSRATSGTRSGAGAGASGSRSGSGSASRPPRRARGLRRQESGRSIRTLPEYTSEPGDEETTLLRRDRSTGGSRRSRHGHGADVADTDPLGTLLEEEPRGTSSRNTSPNSSTDSLGRSRRMSSASRLTLGEPMEADVGTLSYAYTREYATPWEAAAEAAQGGVPAPGYDVPDHSDVPGYDEAMARGAAAAAGGGGAAQAESAWPEGEAERPGVSDGQQQPADASGSRDATAPAEVARSSGPAPPAPATTST